MELLDLDTEPGTPATPATAATNPLPAQGFATPVHQAPPQTFAPPASQQPPLTAIATMTGPIAPSWQTAPPPPASPGRRGPIVALSVGAVGVVAAVAIAISMSSSPDKTTRHSGGGTQSSAQSGTQSSTQSQVHSQSQSTSPTSSAKPAGAIPGGYLGSWQGFATGGGLSQPLAFAVTVAQGQPGDPVGVVTNDGGDGQMCQIKTSLVSASPARMVLRVIPNTVSTGCVPIMQDQIYTLNQDGTMQLSLGDYRAQLSRA